MLLLPEGLHLSSECFLNKDKKWYKEFSWCVLQKFIICYMMTFFLLITHCPSSGILLTFIALLSYTFQQKDYTLQCSLRFEKWSVRFLKLNKKRLVTYFLRDIQSDKTYMRHIWQQKRISHGGRSSKFTKRTQILGRRERDCPARLNLAEGDNLAEGHTIG